MSNNFIFTSESVTTGHPDKLCDQVSDAIVDRFLNQDPDSRIVAECAVSSGVMFISAHYASKARLDIPDIARANAQILEDLEGGASGISLVMPQSVGAGEHGLAITGPDDLERLFERVELDLISVRLDA